MQVEDYKMTGSELNELYSRVKRSHRSVQAFADYIGVGRTYLYDAFKMEQIPHDIDEAIDKFPELVQIKNKIFKGAGVNTSDANDVGQDIGPSKALLTEMLQGITKTMNELAESHKYYREVVQMAQQAGAIKYSFDKSKAVTVSSKT